MLLLQSRSQGHGQAARLRGQQQLFRVCLAVALESTVVGEGCNQSTAADLERPFTLPCRPRPFHRCGAPKRCHDASSCCDSATSLRTRGITSVPYSSTFFINASCDRPGIPNFRSKRFAPSTARLSTIFSATVSGDPTNKAPRGPTSNMNDSL